MDLNDKQKTTIFVLNCTYGMNLADDFQNCCQTAEKNLDMHGWADIEAETGKALKKKYPGRIEKLLGYE